MRTSTSISLGRSGGNFLARQSRPARHQRPGVASPRPGKKPDASRTKTDEYSGYVRCRVLPAKVVSDDDKVDAEDSDGNDEWIGFDANDSALPQHDQIIEDTSLQR